MIIRWPLHKRARTGDDARMRNTHNSDIRDRIDRVHWYHEFDFGQGLRAQVKTPDAESHRRLWRFIEGELDKIDFAGKTVLDIGCWDGYWSFYAERRKAARVLATDDSTQNWAGTAGFNLAKELLASKVESDLNTSIYDLGSKFHEKFDIILCLGVFYHLFDPFYAFAQIRHCCHPNTIVILEGDVFFGLVRSDVQSAALYGRNVRQAPRFVPDPDTLRLLINAAYLTIDSEALLSLSNATTEDVSPRGVNRMLLKCQACVCANECYEYRSPFGLHQYDTRASLPAKNWSSLYMGG
jgi:tRNA (mo5U34)-methyltransferase